MIDVNSVVDSLSTVARTITPHVVTSYGARLAAEWSAAWMAVGIGLLLNILGFIAPQKPYEEPVLSFFLWILGGILIIAGFVHIIGNYPLLQAYQADPLGTTILHFIGK